MDVAGSAVIGASRDLVWTALQDPAVLVRTIPGCERLEETGPDAYRMTVTAGVASIKGVYQGEVVLSDPLELESFTLRARGQGAPGTVDATVRVRLSETDGGTRVDYDADAVVGGMIGGVGQRMLTSVARRTAADFFAAVDAYLNTPAIATEEAAILTDLNLPYEPAITTAPGAPGTPQYAGEVGAAPRYAGEAGVGGAAQYAGEGGVAGAPQYTGGGGVGGVRESAPARPFVPAQPTGPAGGTAGRAPGAERRGAVYERPAPTRRPAETRPWVMLASFGMGAAVALAGAALGWLVGRTSRRH
ncbi:SRPBCC family protein [Nonomuraea maritima]|uniref:SRPBCC family protein n=1 Tax=Nonomuraea maritima TaxID=683260 RepID=UPI00371B85B6